MRLYATCAIFFVTATFWSTVESLSCHTCSDISGGGSKPNTFRGAGGSNSNSGGGGGSNSNSLGGGGGSNSNSLGGGSGSNSNSLGGGGGSNSNSLGGEGGSNSNSLGGGGLNSNSGGGGSNSWGGGSDSNSLGGGGTNSNSGGGGSDSWGGGSDSNSLGGGGTNSNSGGSDSNSLGGGGSNSVGGSDSNSQGGIKSRSGISETTGGHMISSCSSETSQQCGSASAKCLYIEIMETIEEGELTKTRVVKGCSDNGHLEDSLDSYEERLREGTAHDELNIWTKVNEVADNRCDTIEEKLGTFKICSCDSDNCNDGTQPFGDNGSATLHVAFSTVVAALLISEVFRVHF